MSGYWNRVRAFSPDVWRILLAALLFLMVWVGLLAVLYNLYLLRLGFDTATIGLLVGVGSLVWGLASLPAGFVGSRIGQRNSVMLGILVFGGGIALTTLVEMQPRDQWLAWLYASEVVMNIGIALVTVNALPYLMSVSNADERPYAFAFLAASNPLGAVIGSLLAGVLSKLLAGFEGVGLDQPGPFRLALWVGPLVCLLSLIPLLAADPGRINIGDGKSAAGRQRAAKAPLATIALWGLIVFLAATAEGSVRTFFNVLLDTSLHVDPGTIGLIMGAAQVIPILVALAVPLLFIRWGAGYTLLFAILVLAGCLLPSVLGSYAAAQDPASGGLLVWLFSAIYLIASSIFVVIRASRNLFGQELVLPQWRTASAGSAMLGLAFGLSAASAVGGVVIKSFGYSVLFLLGTLVALLAAGLLYLFLRRSVRESSKQPVARTA